MFLNGKAFVNRPVIYYLKYSYYIIFKYIFAPQHCWFDSLNGVWLLSTVMNDYKTSSFMQMLKVKPSPPRNTNLLPSHCRPVPGKPSRLLPKLQCELFAYVSHVCHSIENATARVNVLGRKCWWVSSVALRLRGCVSGQRSHDLLSRQRKVKSSLGQEDSDGSGWQTLCRGQWVAQL